MRFRTILLAMLALLLAAGPVFAVPSVKQSGSSVIVTESLTAEGEAQLKAVAAVAPERLSLTLKKIKNEDLVKICAMFPQLKQLEVSDSKELTSIAPVAGLTQLTRLTVRNSNGVQDFTPLAGLVNLENIDVSSDAMGPDLKWMSGLAKLQRISVTGGKNLTSFEGLPALQVSSISLNGASPADLSPLLVMSNLKKLDLKSCTIADLTPLAKLPNLTDLNLYGSAVKDFSPLAACPKLKTLMYYAVKDADFSTLGKLTQLEELKGGLTKLADISWLANLPGLKKFDVFSEYVKDYSPLAKSNVEKFQIWSMREPVGDLGVVGQAKTLKELKLWSVDGATNSKGLSGLANLEKFTITSEYNQKSGEPFDFAAASGWAKVKEIDVTGADVVNMDGLAAASALKTLKLSKMNKKSGAPVSLAVAGKLASLSTLSIVDAKVSDFEALAGCVNLKTLYLKKVEGVTSLDALKKLPNLKRLSISKDMVPETELTGFAGDVKITKM